MDQEMLRMGVELRNEQRQPDDLGPGTEDGDDLQRAILLCLGEGRRDCPEAAALSAAAPRRAPSSSSRAARAARAARGSPRKSPARRRTNTPTARSSAAAVARRFPAAAA